MKKILPVVLLFLVPAALFPSASSDSLVTRGWDLWNENKLSEIEQLFKHAIKTDPADLRAYFSLSYLYKLQGKNEASWEAFRSGMDRAPSPYPYLSAAWITEKFLHNADQEKSGIIELLTKVSKDQTASDKLQANALSRLGEYYEKKNKLSESKKYYDQLKTISDWRLIGPFDNTSASGFQNVFPPETEFNAVKKYSGKNEIPVKWFVFKTIRNDRWIDFTRYFGYDNAVYYANTFIHSDVKRSVQVRVGTSGSLKTFLNDQCIIAVRDENNNDMDTYIAETELQQGWNRVLIKCGYSEIANCNFMFRLTDVNGVPLNDIEISTDAKPYVPVSNAPVVSIENFAEKYFRLQIADHPDRIENYFLLSDVYLRNDKAVEGEALLKQVMAKLPNCSLVYEQLIEAYMRGEKRSEVSDLYEKLALLKPDLPSVIMFQYYQSMGNEDYDTAEKKIQTYAKLLPGNKQMYVMYIDFYSKKKQVDKLIEIVNEAYKNFPTEWIFVKIRAAIVLQTERNFAPALEVLKEYLDQEYTKDGVYAVAELYLRANDVKSFEKEFNKLFDLTPTSPGYYLQLAEVYIQLQQYPKAESAVRKAMDITPSNSTVLEKLGTILRMMGRNEEAKQAFREALLNQPTKYDSRENLRELESKPFIFTNFPSVDVRALIQTAPSAEKYPDDAAIYLLDDTKRVVYPEGASEYSREVVVKVFNSRGVDYFNEFWIGYNSYSENLIVERAVVIKKDGTEVKADIDRNNVVFKSLESGDIIHMKWRVKNFYNGNLSRHFWDQVNFNGFLPMANVRYSMIVPPGKHFSYRMQNSNMKPAIDTLSDGVRYSWKRENVPSLETEQNMPGSAEIGIVLYISSLPSWEYIVQWYSDLAREKTASSYEIREQVKELFTGKENADEMEKIRTIYNFITEKIRYSNVSFRQSAYIPQPARNVLVHKLGDCKDVATLCVAMLKEVGIRSYHVLVNTRNEGYNRNILPSIAFNHCIVAVETSGGLKYFDLTAYNYPAGSIPLMDQGAFALTIKPGVKEPFYLDQSMFMPRNLLRTQEITLGKENSAQFKKTSRRTGSSAGSYRETFRNLGKKDQEKELVRLLSDDYANVKLQSFEFKNLDSPDSSISINMVFTALNFVTKAAGMTIVKNLWTDKFTSFEALSDEQRDFAFYFYPGIDTLKETVTINLEPGMKPVDLVPSTVIKSVFGDYALTYTVGKGVITAQRELIYKKEIIQPEEYTAFKEFYNKVQLADEVNIVLKK